MGDDDCQLKDDAPLAQSDEQPVDDWQVDDSGIPDDALTLRRLTEDGQVVYDDINECNVIGIAAYQYRDDGMSVYVSTAMESEELSEDELMPYCQHGIARVPLEIIRRQDEGKLWVRGDTSTTVPAGEERETPGGVVLSEATTGPDDPRIRRSHGLVRIRERPLARVLWNAFRHKLIQGSEYRAPGSEVWVPASGAA